MGVRRAQHLEMQEAIDGDIHRVAGLAGQDGVGKGIGQAGAECIARHVLLDVALALKGVGDRAIAGTAADVALERVRQVGLVRLVERGGRRGHQHAGGAVTALEGLRVVKGLLHRVQFAVLGQTFDGRDLAPLGAKGGDQAGMERFAVDMHRTGAAIAGVAALLHAEDLEIAQEGAQTLAGLGCRRIETAVDLQRAHASSIRICSAR